MENLDHELPYVLTDALWFPEGGNGEHLTMCSLLRCALPLWAVWFMYSASVLQARWQGNSVPTWAAGAHQQLRLCTTCTAQLRGHHCGWLGGLPCTWQDRHAMQAVTAELRLPAAGTKAHPNREAPRCLPCGFEDELLDKQGCPGHRGYIAAKVGPYWDSLPFRLPGAAANPAPIDY